jgi:hypothetical protein
MAAAIIVFVSGGALITVQMRRPSTADPTRSGEAAAALTAQRLGADSLRLSWPAVDDATGYVIELLNDAGDVIVTERTTDTAFTVANTRASGATRAWVRAERRDGSGRTTPAIALPLLSPR